MANSKLSPFECLNFRDGESADYISLCGCGNSSRSCKSGSIRSFSIVPQLDVQQLELSVKMGTLQSGPLGHPRHIAVFLIDKLFKIDFLEHIACFTQWHV